MQKSFEESGGDFVVHRNGNENIGAAQIANALKITRSDADDAVLELVHLNGLVQNLRVAAESRLPQIVANHGDGARGGVLVGRKSAAKNGMNAENVEEIRVDHVAEELHMVL